MEYLVEVRKLTDAFLEAYPRDRYPEIERKQNRPYSCLLLQFGDSYTICIPFRSHISHPNSYRFRSTERSRRTDSGLDYSKCVLVNDPKYIDTTPAIVDKDEYNEMIRNIDTIIRQVCAYIEDYKGYIRGTTTLHHREFARRYQYSTLPYFHDILFAEDAVA